MLPRRMPAMMPAVTPKMIAKTIAMRPACTVTGQACARMSLISGR